MITPDYHSFFLPFYILGRTFNTLYITIFKNLHKIFCYILSFFVFMHKGQNCPKVQNLNIITCGGIYLCTGNYFFKPAFYCSYIFIFYLFWEFIYFIFCLLSRDIPLLYWRILLCRQDRAYQGSATKHDICLRIRDGLKKPWT